MVARVRAYGAWQWLTPAAQRGEEEPAGESTDFVPRRIRGQGVGPEAAAADGIELAEATTDGLKVEQTLGFEGSALRESFGDAADQLQLLDDGFRLEPTPAQPGKLITAVGSEEGHESQRPGSQARVAKTVRHDAADSPGVFA